MANFGDVRYGFQGELQNPATRNALYALTHAETGGQGPAAQQAFMESVFNRATARGKSLQDTIYDRGYYPGTTYARMGQGVPAQAAGQYGGMLDAVMGGSDLTKGGTGNASGSVMFAGGPQTLATGGERFGVEGPDRGWQNRAQPAPNPYGPEGLNEAGPNGPAPLGLLKFGGPDGKGVDPASLPPQQQMMALGGPRMADGLLDNPRTQNQGGMSPLVMMGLGMLTSAAQGGDYSKGMLGGAQAAQGFDQNRISELNSERGWAMKQRELQRQQQADEMMRNLPNNPAFAKFIGPEIISAARSMPTDAATKLIQDAIIQRQKQAGDLDQARALQEQNTSALMDFIRQNKALEEGSRPQSAVPRFGPNDKAKFDALPKGARFYGPDGQMREKQ